jgi:hypothetical protein
MNCVCVVIRQNYYIIFYKKCTTIDTSNRAEIRLDMVYRMVTLTHRNVRYDIYRTRVTISADTCLIHGSPSDTVGILNHIEYRSQFAVCRFSDAVLAFIFERLFKDF